MDTLHETTTRDAWYAHVFAQFVARSSEYSDLLAWLKAHIERTPLYTAGSVLSVGAGTGELDLALASMLPQLTRYTVVEPNAEHLAVFRGQAGDDPVFRFHRAALEQMRLPRHDVALIAHALYYVADRRMALARLVASAGEVVIVHQSELGIHEVQQRFGDAATLRHAYSSRDILRDLEILGFPARRVRVDSHVDVTDPDPALIGFLLERPATHHERAGVREYLAHRYPDGRMHHPVDIIITHA